MRITLDIADDLAPFLARDPAELPRTVLEALGIEAWRAGRLSEFQLRTLLGFHSRFQLDGFLKERGVFDYTLSDFQLDWEGLRDLRRTQPAEVKAALPA